MVTFLKTVDDTAIIRLILGKESKIQTSVNGEDIVNIDDYYNIISNNDNIKHAMLSVTYCANEQDIMKYIKDHESKFEKKSVDSDSIDKKHDEEEKSYDFTCPVCQSNEGLIDKDGHTHPCVSCMTIDIGRKIQHDFEKKYKKNKKNGEKE